MTQQYSIWSTGELMMRIVMVTPGSKYVIFKPYSDFVDIDLITNTSLKKIPSAAWKPYVP